MNVNKIVVIALVALMSLPAAAYAGTYTTSKTGVKLVEGHTVYAVLTKETNVCPDPNNCPPQKEEGTAVAVLTREYICTYGTPAQLEGVLWFNDQFLVGDDSAANAAATCTYRFPCGGTIYAVPAGAGDRLGDIEDVIEDFQYVESYRIMDPNDLIWEIDLWRVPLDYASLGIDDSLFPAPLKGVPIWTVNVGGTGNPGGFNAEAVADNGNASCTPFDDVKARAAAANPAVGAPYPGKGATDVPSPGTAPTSGYAAPTDPVGIWYNGLLFMRWKDISYSLPGTVTHDQANVAPTQCAPGAAADTNTCGGYSHPYNPDPDAEPSHTHETAQVDIYFTSAARPVPGARSFWINDNVGSGAPFHTHP